MEKILNPYEIAGAWVPVMSSRVSRFKYDSDTRVLTVQYKRGHVYLYSPVTPAFVSRLAGSESIGIAIGELICDPTVTSQFVGVAGGSI